MTTTARVFFLLSCAITGGIIYSVHSYQEEERVRMRSGVLKDIERKREKLQEAANRENNLEMIKAQIELEKKLSKQE